jgi:hypothetical protein
MTVPPPKPDPAARIADALDRLEAVLWAINEKLDQLVKARSSEN